MVSHDERALWGYASSELDFEGVAVLEEHLSLCPECRDQLDAIRAARLLLKSAGAVAPPVQWAQVDAGLDVARARRAKVKWHLPRLVLAGAVVAALAGALWFAMPRAPPPLDVPAKTASVPAAAPLPAWVEKANGATRHVPGQPTVATTAGDAWRPGSSLRTSSTGTAVVGLSDRSRVKVGQTSQVFLVRGDADDVALRLERGRVVTRASHRLGRSFVIEAAGVRVRVVGTAFSVGLRGKTVEVAVAEGRVEVERPGELPAYVSAGQRVRFEPGTRRSAPLPPEASLQADLRELDLDVAPEPLVASADTGPRTPPASPGARDVGTRPSAGRSAATVDVPPSPAQVAPAPEAQVIGEAVRLDPEPPAPTAKPAMAPPSAELPAAPLEAAPEPSKLREEDPEPRSSGEVAPAALDGLPIDEEGRVLRRAERALREGTCTKDLEALGEIARSSERVHYRERARLFRARCFDSRVMVGEAAREYQRYLRDFPSGPASDEARRALAFDGW